MIVQVRNTKRFQKYFKTYVERTRYKILEKFHDEKGNEQLIIDLTYFSTSMGSDIEADRIGKVIIDAYFGKQIYNY